MTRRGVRLRRAAWLTPLVLLGCTPSTDPAPDAPAPPRDRAGWRAVLGWPDDCEQAFAASFAGEGDGIEVQQLADGRALVAVLCAGGAYQPSYRYYLAPGAGAPAVALALPTYVSPDGETLSCSLEQEVFGEPSFLRDGAGWVVLSLSRQTADCGTWARYAVADGHAELRELRAQVRCPAEVGEPVDSASAEPPARWPALALHTPSGSSGCP